jgi:hypothetical protein
MIVFGIRHFTLKEISASSLGLPGKKDLAFVQSYFHLMYIPFFPLAKFWVTREDKNEMRLVGPDILLLLEEKKIIQPKTPWYSWAGPMLSVLIAGIYFLGTSLSSQHQHSADEESFNKNRDGLLYLVNHPTNYDYYKITFDYEAGAHDQTNTTVFRVMQFNDTAIQFASGHEEIFEYPKLEETADWTALFNDSTVHNLFWVNRKTLAQAVDSSFDENKKSAGVYTYLFSGMHYIRVDEVKRIDGPMLEYYGKAGAKFDVNFNLRSCGEYFDNLFITKTTGKGNWTMEPVPDYGKYVTNFYNSDAKDSPYSLSLECRDARGKIHHFEVNGSGNKITIRRLP